MPQPIEIVHLLDAPAFAQTLEHWFVAEWAPWYGTTGPGDAAADLAACCKRDELPICLIARQSNGVVVGTASLKDESVGSELGVSPWLAAVLVPKEHHGLGIGTALVRAIVDEAIRRGFDAVYSSTDSAAGILMRGGWREYGATTSLRGHLKVFRRQLATKIK